MAKPETTIQKLDRIVGELRTSYADDPNIVSIGWGNPIRNGEYQTELALLISVKLKIGSTRRIEALGSVMIPRAIESVPTDVQTHTPLKKLGSADNRDEIEFNPLVGGPASSNAEEHVWWFNGGGTLGLLVRDANTDAPMALSNWHVWADGGDEGDKIIQPGHPNLGEHIAGVGAILSCGPIIASLVNGNVPSPLSLGLYGGAAAAAALAACTDYEDPFRRGQEHTPPGADELTELETADIESTFDRIPWAGKAFRAKVHWDYERITNEKTHAYSVEEEVVNPQFLLGQQLSFSARRYKPGQVIGIRAVIWDYQPRPCDSYLAVAHLMPNDSSGKHYPVLLHPTECGDSQSERDRLCINWEEDRSATSYPYKHVFDWLKVNAVVQEKLRIVDWYVSNGNAGKGELVIPDSGIYFHHQPAKKVEVTIVLFNSSPITMEVFGQNGVLLGTVSTDVTQNVEHTLEFESDMIAWTRISGGQNEGVMLEYCIDPVEQKNPEAVFDKNLVTRLERVKTPIIARAELRFRTKKCCFEGSFVVPPTAPSGRWRALLVVQNINHVPDGVDPLVAASIIGGHILTDNVAQTTGCGGEENPDGEIIIEPLPPQPPPFH